MPAFAVLHSFIHSFSLFFFFLSLCVTTGPQPLPKPVLHTVPSSTFCFSLQYHLFALSHQIDSYDFFLFFPLLLSFLLSFFLSFNNMFYNAVPAPNVSNPVSLPSVYFCKIIRSKYKILMEQLFKYACFWLQACIKIIIKQTQIRGRILNEFRILIYVEYLLQVHN